jgi:hypothetical protein
MEGREGALALDVAALRTNFSDFERQLARGLSVVVFADRPSDAADAFAGHLAPLMGKQDARSDWRAMRDSWRLRHVSTCFGLATRAGYRWRIEETGSRISLVFEPEAGAPGTT